MYKTEDWGIREVSEKVALEEMLAFSPFLGAGEMGRGGSGERRVSVKTQRLVSPRKQHLLTAGGSGVRWPR